MIVREHQQDYDQAARELSYETRWPCLLCNEQSGPMHRDFCVRLKARADSIQSDRQFAKKRKRSRFTVPR